jgi:hypothetical protein
MEKLEKINMQALENRLDHLEDAIETKSLNHLVYAIHHYSDFLDSLTGLSEKNKQKYQGKFYEKLNDILKDNWEYIK